ncbi:LysR family transcriptional regulator [Pelagibius litoralis]|uniref:LysR family transcriptional regulator n=1 Tax=Pelagibius litoralis TaxID=374515 RepID=A0A967F1P0_9PROT|nr:LysR substrate-binding domain-containing protein [Pelagibius litoralis]NIA71408.1 LysR family transcriptional regulator [Pelagibius litoralis]
MRAPNLRQIEAFKAVIETGTVSRAAELLHVSQPAASKLLTHLEEDTGLQLFDRRRGRLVPTERGMRLYEEIDRIFAGVKQIERAVESIRREDNERLLIGVMPGLAGPFIRQAVAGFLKRHPNAYVSVAARSSQFIADWLIARQLDVGVISMKVDHQHFEAEPLISQPLVCAMPIGHRLAKKRKVTPADLVEERFISFSPGSHTQLRIDAVFRKFGLTPTVGLDASMAPTVCELVAAGLGVTLVHPLLLESVRGRVVVRPFDPPTPLDFLLCRPREARNMDLVDAFVDETRKAAAEISRNLLSD